MAKLANCFVCRVPDMRYNENGLNAQVQPKRWLFRQSGQLGKMNSNEGNDMSRNYIKKPSPVDFPPPDRSGFGILGY
jgi:hypothetical protein